MYYPAAFCVNCQQHVRLNGQKTVVLKNDSRALTGTCPKCGCDAYRIMPKKKKETIFSPSSEKYPDGFCFKCQDIRPITRQKTVILANDKVAVHGACRSCGGKMSRLLGERSPKSDVATGRSRVLSIVPQPEVQKDQLSVATAARRPVAQTKLSRGQVIMHSHKSRPPVSSTNGEERSSADPSSKRSIYLLTVNRPDMAARDSGMDWRVVALCIFTLAVCGIAFVVANA